MTEKKEEQKEIPEEKVQDIDLPEGFGTLEDVEPNLWRAEEEGDSISGILVNQEPRSGDLSARYFLDTEKGVVLVWGCKVLDDRMALVKTGDFVRITYKGTKQLKKDRKLHLYKVEVAKHNE